MLAYHEFHFDSLERCDARPGHHRSHGTYKHVEASEHEWRSIINHEAVLVDAGSSVHHSPEKRSFTHVNGSEWPKGFFIPGLSSFSRWSWSEEAMLRIWMLAALLLAAKFPLLRFDNSCAVVLAAVEEANACNLSTLISSSLTSLVFVWLPPNWQISTDPWAMKTFPCPIELSDQVRAVNWSMLLFRMECIADISPLKSLLIYFTEGICVC